MSESLGRSSLIEKLPTIDEINYELSRNAREGRLLRSLRIMLKRKEKREQAAEILRQR